MIRFDDSYLKKLRWYENSPELCLMTDRELEDMKNSHLQHTALKLTPFRYPCEIKPDVLSNDSEIRLFAHPKAINMCFVDISKGLHPRVIYLL